ncbi:MAG: O-antigen ligase family protein [Deltaproteobacteria bacterium]|nr:O-antigen ligase family protein [Deltaproteobacteria bacterium]
MKNLRIPTWLCSIWQRPLSPTEKLALFTDKHLMLPKASLIICTIFVTYLLFIDRKQENKPPFSRWIPTLWLLLVFSKPLGVWFGVLGEDMQSGSPLDRKFLLFLFILSLTILFRRKILWIKVFQYNFPLLCMILFMLFSIFWSDIFISSFKRWSREIIAISMGLLIATENNPFIAIQSILRRMVYILIPFSFILIHYFAEYGREYARWSGELMWIGAATQKNGLGMICVTSVIFLIWDFNANRKFYESNHKIFTLSNILVLIITFYLMGGPNHTLFYSVTSNIACIIGLLVIFTHVKLHRLPFTKQSVYFSIFISFVIIYGILVPFSGKLIGIDLSLILGRDESLTGRDEIWRRLIPYATNHFFLGHGYGGFWTSEIRELTDAHAHNGYLDIVLNTGFLGLLLFWNFLMSCIKKSYIAIKNYNSYHLGILSLTFIAILSFHNIAESSTVGINGKFISIVLFFSLLFDGRVKNKTANF